ncbi:hypothetical protein [Anaerotignum sp.]|uniref:hypothetical protein n=1 Tax=Anaerotignum sp. TaxID=2039241 RepID=UPI0027155405|nr:hypothetical protein [Anaerotignum sp.]
MIRPELLRDIGDLANEELLFANQKFPLFASPHEGYAVLKEEIEETVDEAESLKENAKSLWYQIKNNSDVSLRIEMIESHALQCAAEAIQVVAMCRKYRDSLGGAK